MATLRTLKREALEAARSHGHRMDRFTPTDWENMVYSECHKCGKGVLVTDKPQPNQAEIMGRAVALGCEP